MKTCSAIKKNGERCRAYHMRGSEFCTFHHPGRAAKNGSKGMRGPSTTTTELKRLQDEFERLAADVEHKRLDRAIGAVAGQLLNSARACVRDMVAAREQEELVQRLEALEEALGRQQRTTTRTGPYRLT